jgi:hypothetical protein
VPGRRLPEHADGIAEVLMSLEIPKRHISPNHETWRRSSFGRSHRDSGQDENESYGKTRSCPDEFAFGT